MTTASDDKHTPGQRYRLSDLIERIDEALDMLGIDSESSTIVSLADFANLAAHQRVLRAADHAAVALRDAANYLADLKQRT
jgi:hypothetical protein